MSPVQPSPLSVYGPYLVSFFILVELSISLWKRDRTYSLKDTLANLAITLVGTPLGRMVWTVLAYLAYGWASQFAPVSIPMDHWASWLALVLISDFAWYWEHRLGHEVRLLWGIHSVHHSSEKFNYSIAFRLPWLGGLARIPFLMPLALIGFSPWAIIAGHATVFLYQIVIHTTYVRKLGWLENVFNTPSHHRVHHATNQEYIDKNYGGIFIFWDKLFGTFQEEGAPAQYGILHPIKSHNPFVINSRDLIDTFKEALRSGSLRKGLQVAFGRP